MSDASMLEDAFGHHVWATLQLIDVCAALEPSQLETAVPGTYGSILDTMRHLVASDSWYLYRLQGLPSPITDETALDVPALREAMEASGPAWSRVVGADLDPAALVGGEADDGSKVSWPASIRIAQALHHGTDHRSQICTALTALDVEPPSIDVWDFAEQHGRMVVESPPG